VIFNHNGLERSFTHPIAETVYRVIQEALTNVAKYAGVTEVQIDAQADNSHLTIMIKDKGKGFDFTKLAGNLSFGLRGMSERLFAV
jgi:signal transduction histidine kinase